jgi:isoquinoline 1-oxidoreductase beta subunit
VLAEEYRAERAAVRHPSSGRTAGYGEFVLEANRQQVPQDPPLKAESDWKLIGLSTRRVETPSTADGSALFASMRGCPI